MKKKYLSILLIFLLSISLVACGSNDTEEEQEIEEEEDEEVVEEEPVLETEEEDGKEQEVKVGDTFILGENDITVNSAERHEGKDDDILLVVNYTWTNNGDDTAGWDGATGSRGYQDSIQIDRVMIMDDEEIENNIDKGVQPGGTLDNIKEFYVTNGNDTEIDIILNVEGDYEDEYGTVLIKVD